jgi:hypothetical protein
MKKMLGITLCVILSAVFISCNKAKPAEGGAEGSVYELSF